MEAIWGCSLVGRARCQLFRAVPLRETQGEFVPGLARAIQCTHPVNMGHTEWKLFVNTEVRYSTDSEKNKSLRFALYNARGGACHWCRKPKDFLDIQIDHVIPTKMDEQQREKLLRIFSRTTKGSRYQSRVRAVVDRPADISD